MSLLGQSRRFDPQPATSGLHSETDIARAGRHVSKVPPTDMPLLGAVRLTGMVVDQVAVNAGFDFRATVIGVLIGVHGVWIVNRSKGWYESNSAAAQGAEKTG